ncbi:Hypothetical_protein [Hexamita inflata]|uniref:Hypothetical_protein n=1 Tax=Hexamita inflata TaxID=28002 RepID=A0AA86NMP2_9EUKA|nr:Hypothetical protein HINF_LOCUS9943 [Hexamita inflata]
MPNTLKNMFKLKQIQPRTLILQPLTQILKRNQTSSKTSLQMCVQQPDLYEVETKLQESPRFQTIRNELNATVELQMVMNELIEGDNSYFILQIKGQSKIVKQMMHRCQQLEECTDSLMNNVGQLIESNTCLKAVTSNLLCQQYWQEITRDDNK